MSTDERTADRREFAGGELAIANHGGTGLITRPRDRGLSPALAAEAQRAKSEIEASLTIAAARPRDERLALDQILLSCQRAGVAEEAEFEYSRGGTAITGATIRLLELVAQKWGNLCWGFRELARYDGDAGHPGSSTVQAFAWDLQSNSRRTVDFIVPHAIKSHNKTKVLTDERDVYELIANVAQRRVRTSLENVVPRDIVDSAVEECRKTLKTNEAMSPEKTVKMVKAFAEFGVTAAHIEAWLQRRIDTMTPAQMVRLRRIYTSLRDGMSTPEDWFQVAQPEAPKSAMDAAKQALRKPAPTADPESPLDTGGDADQPAPENQDAEPADDGPSAEQILSCIVDFRTETDSCQSVGEVALAWNRMTKAEPPQEVLAKCKEIFNSRTEELRDKSRREAAKQRK
jgi:hypothetical protein